MATRILSVVRTPAFKLLFVPAFTVPITGVIEFLRSIRSHR